MASSPEVITQPLKYKIWVLKVPIHCVGCKREVKKLLHTIEGVYSTSIDSQQQKVTVTGNIDDQTLVKKLLKAGKHAEIWNEKSSPSQKNEKQTESKAAQNKEQTTKANNSKTTPSPKNTTKEIKPEKERENSPNAEIGGKKKNGKGQKGNLSGDKTHESPPSTGLIHQTESRSQGAKTTNLSPTSEKFNVIQGPPTPLVMNYSATYPTPPYSSSEQIDNYQVQATAFNSFDIFSDENTNGCSIM